MWNQCLGKCMVLHVQIKIKWRIMFSKISWGFIKLQWEMNSELVSDCYVMRSYIKYTNIFFFIELNNQNQQPLIEPLSNWKRNLILPAVLWNKSNFLHAPGKGWGTAPHAGHAVGRGSTGVWMQVVWQQILGSSLETRTPAQHNGSMLGDSRGRVQSSDGYAWLGA